MGRRADRVAVEVGLSPLSLLTRRRWALLAVALLAAVFARSALASPDAGSLEIVLPPPPIAGPWSYEVRLQGAEHEEVAACRPDATRTCRFTVAPGTYAAIIQSPWSRPAMLTELEVTSGSTQRVEHRDPALESKGPVDLPGFRDRVLTALETTALRNQCAREQCTWIRGLRAWDRRFGSHGYEGVIVWTTPRGASVRAVSVACGTRRDRCKAGATVQTASADLTREQWKELYHLFSDRSSPGMAAKTVPGGGCDGVDDQVQLERSAPPMVTHRSCGQFGAGELQQVLTRMFDAAGMSQRASAK